MKKIILSFISCMIMHTLHCAQAPAPAHISPACAISWSIYFGGYRQQYPASHSYDTPAAQVAKKKKTELETFKATSNLYELTSITEKIVPLPHSSRIEQRTIFTVNFKQGPLKYLSMATSRSLVFLTAEQEKIFQDQLSSMKQTQTVEPFEFSVRHQ